MKYFIVRKLNNEHSPVVNSIVDRLKHIFNAFEDEIVSRVEDADAVIAIGGDGTVLHALRQTAFGEIPVICFNIGKLGFLAEFSPIAIEETIINAKIASKNRIDHRTLLFSEEIKCNAVNEFVISPKLTQHTLTYEFFINGVSSGKHRANGLIIGTPTGSTAYSLSVGGAIIQPESPVFQICPISPMSLNARSIIVSDDAVIDVVIHPIFPYSGDEYCIIADGQYNHIDRDTRDNNVITLRFRKSHTSATLLHHLDWNFFKVLQEKLHWNVVI